MTKSGLLTITLGDWNAMDESTRARYLGFEEGLAQRKRQLAQTAQHQSNRR